MIVLLTQEFAHDIVSNHASQSLALCNMAAATSTRSWASVVSGIPAETKHTTALDVDATSKACDTDMLSTKDVAVVDKRDIVEQFLQALSTQNPDCLAALAPHVHFGDDKHTENPRLQALFLVRKLINDDNLECFVPVWNAMHVKSFEKRLQLNDPDDDSFEDRFSATPATETACTFGHGNESEFPRFDDQLVYWAYIAQARQRVKQRYTIDDEPVVLGVHAAAKTVESSRIVAFLQDQDSKHETFPSLWLIALRLAEFISSDIPGEPTYQTAVVCLIDDLDKCRWRCKYEPHYYNYSHLKMIDAVLFCRVDELLTFARLQLRRLTSDPPLNMAAYSDTDMWTRTCLVPGIEDCWVDVSPSLTQEQLVTLRILRDLCRDDIAWCQGLAEIALLWWMFQPRSILQEPLFRHEQARAIIDKCLTKHAALEAGDFALPTMIANMQSGTAPSSLGLFAFERCKAAMDARFHSLRTLQEPRWHIFVHTYTAWRDHVNRFRRVFGLGDLETTRSIEPQWGDSDSEDEFVYA